MEERSYLKAIFYFQIMALLLAISPIDVKATEFIADNGPSFNSARTIIQTDGKAKNQPDSSPEPEIRFQRRAVIPGSTEVAAPVVAEPETALESAAPRGNTAPQKSTAPLSRSDRLLAKKAQYYFDRNWNKNTGLIDSVQGYHHATMWDIASGIAAILAMEKLDMISSIQADAKLDKTFSTLASMPLYNKQLPNREYNTKTGLPSGKFSKSASNGNGWSALDIGRLLIWLEISAHYKPQFSEQIDQIKARWDLGQAVSKKTLYGEYRSRNGKAYRQEGRLGYLQYAAQGYQLAGLDVSSAFKHDHSQTVILDGVELYIDERNLPFFTTDPYVLQTIEMGDKEVWWNQLRPLYQLHRKGYEKRQKHWIFAEDAMNRAPWFAYNNLHFYGKGWLSTSSGGKPIENPQVFSNKIAFALSVIFNDPFSRQLANIVIENSLSSRSVPTGVYQNETPNTAYNINTNSLILVSLWYKSRNQTAILPMDNPIP